MREERDGDRRAGAGWTARIEAAVIRFRTVFGPWKVIAGAALGLLLVAGRLAAFGFSPELPFLVFYPGVVIAAGLGGGGSGAGVAVVGLLAASLWTPPAASAAFAVRLGGFLFYTLAVCTLAEAFHRALLRLGEANDRREVAEKLLVASEQVRLAASERMGTFDIDLVRGEATEAEAVRRIFGLSHLGTVNFARVLGLVLPEDRPKMQAALAAACDPSGEGAYQAEYRIRREDNREPRWIIARGQVYFEKGRAVRMIGVCSDISDLRTAELALQASERQIRGFVERAPTEIAMLDRDMTYIAASRRWIANYGRGLDSLVGVNLYELHPRVPERWKMVHRLVATGEFHNYDGELWVDADDRTRWLRWSAFPWTNLAGAIGGVILASEDITAQKQAEAALRESEEKFRNAFAGAAIGFVMAQARGRIIEVNEAFRRLTGYEADELRGMRLADLAHPEDRDAAFEATDALGGGAGSAFVVERRLRKKSGETIFVRDSASLTNDAEGAPWIVHLVEDVTERKRMEDIEARTVAQLTAVLDGAKDGILSIDVEGVVRSINAAGERMFGYERDEVIGRNVTLLMPELLAEHHDGYLRNYLKTGVARMIGSGGESEGRRKNGEVFPIELAITEAAVYNDLMFVGFVRDLSERRRIELRIDQLAAQRLTAIGGMAGALAHELNQPLAAARVYLETARRVLAKPAKQGGPSVDDVIARASAQVVRMGEIIAHLRDFVGHGEPDKIHHGLHALIRRVVAEADADARGHGPAVSLALTAERDEVLMDPVQIGQVVSNLIRNARESVGDSSDGRIEIRTALDGDAIRCDVSDNGPGVAETIMDRLFEPLTSTKARGMGVGLSISKSIVEAHYGAIWAHSNPGGGAVFSFAVPLAAAENDE